MGWMHDAWAVVRGALVLAPLPFVAACAIGPSGPDVDDDPVVAEDTAVAQQASVVPPDVVWALLHLGSLTAADLDQVRHFEHRVNVGGGKQIGMTETYTLRSWLHLPHRAVLMIPAQGSKRSVYNAPFPGYDGGAILAGEGFFTFTADPQGTGDSFQPADGFTVTYASETSDYLKAVDYVRLTRLVGRVDVMGEEIGGGVAMQMAADSTRVRSCVAASMIWRTGSDFFNAAFNSPEFKGAVFGAPDHYFQTFPELYFNVLAGAAPDMAAWFTSTQVGRYAAGTYKEDFDRLFAGGAFYDPTKAEVPGLLIRGENDPNNPLSDVVALANAYGSNPAHGWGHHTTGPAEIAVIEGGSHIVRVDAPPIGTQFWDIVLEFLDP